MSFTDAAQLPVPSTRRQVLLAGSIAAAVALLVMSGVDGLGDTDPARHLRYANELWKSGFRLSGHPFLPFTVLGRQSVDLWWGFHVLLVPFTALGIEWGARATGLCIAFANAATFTFVLRRFGARHAWAFAVLPLVGSEFYLARDWLARPSHLTLPLLFLSLAAGTGALPAATSAGASFLHALVHMSSPLSACFAAFGAALGDRRSLRSRATVVAMSLLGLSLGYLVRPDRAHYLAVALNVSLAATSGFSSGMLPETGQELLPMRWSEYAREVLPLAALLAIALVAGRRRPRTGSPGTRRVSLGLLAIFALAPARNGRWDDYLVPALAVACWWPADPGWLPDRRRLAAAAIGALGMAHLAYVTSDIWKQLDRAFPPLRYVDQLAGAVRANVEPRSVLFTDDTFLGGTLYGSLPEYRYVTAYDPSLLYLASRQDFWRWAHATYDSADCDQPSIADCPGAATGAPALARVMRHFGATWVVSRGHHGPSGLLATLASSPEWFELRGQALGPGSFLSLWHLKVTPNAQGAQDLAEPR